ncbi:Lrp/AsnC family transcriptional regulator [Stakelama tenebrarum]|uniref:Lrp/AsnC family transcriptional regulator n=1 Tax=Stakelama tenebrarum TaxID=2711215 RepID=A0A6G6Y8Y4_9SPHN|nr:Lrp/AsnC family transcriptional regulator [Sphingosinithalassobacter tenebrarum]QIG81402.1 Lrp/AsnC family transcriptional regulator [Sphingosinithalassobacter tenebrarum]
MRSTSASFRSSERLDSFDLQLLELLQQDALMTAERLADHVALSASAITRRVRRLRESGVIRADVAVLACDFTDARLNALVLVQVREHAEERGLGALRERLSATPEVQTLLDISGQYDLALLISARDMNDFNALTDRLLQQDPAVQRYETRFAKRTHKQSLFVPLGTGQD